MFLLKRISIYLYNLYFVYVVSAWYTVLQILSIHNVPNIQNQEGRIALITGGGRGIGFHTAYKLLKVGMTVIIVGIDKDQKEGVEVLKRSYESRVIFLHCDLSSLKSVRQMVGKFRELNLPLHILVNNAGIMFAPRLETAEGFESHWVINYLSHFLLTHLLLNIMIKSGSEQQPSRIVNLGSCLHYIGNINFDDSQGKVSYSAEAAYTQSKLAMVMFASDLDRRLRNKNVPVIVNSVHPAVALTGLYKHVWWAKMIPNLAGCFLTTAEKAADTVVYAAASSEVTDGGNYYDNCSRKIPSKKSQSLSLQKRLWELSCWQANINVCEYY